MNLDQLTLIENASIRKFLEAQSFYMKGRLLDFGCGREPYRDLVERAGAKYHPYDRVEFPCTMAPRDVGSLSTWYETILCTQVVEFVPDVPGLLRRLHDHYLVPGGALIITGPTNMPEVNPEDLHRHTLTGIKRLLEVDFEVVVAEHREASHVFDGFELAFGWGCVAVAR